MSPTIDFLTLDEVRYGVVERVAPRIRRVTAENPSKYTYRGTGTYLVGEGDLAVIDPGPLLDAHRDALSAALAGERVRAILVTHCHADHSPLSAWLHEHTGAARVGFGPHPPPDPADADLLDAGDDGADGGDGGSSTEGEPERVDDALDLDFTPDARCVTGDLVADGPGWRVRAVHTPGHTSNHVCYSLEEDDRPAPSLFTGDHVMGWSTTVVSPPDGDMGEYLESLRAVQGRDDAVHWPTHGPPIPSPQRYVADLIEHRRQREEGVLRCLRDGRTTIAEIVAELYADVRPELHRPAGRSVLAHLVKLHAEGRIAVADAPRPTLRAHYAPT